MIDYKNRKKIILLINQYLAGEISNFTSDDLMSGIMAKTHDKLLKNIIRVLLMLDSDEFIEHKCDISEYGLRIFHRWKTLLSSDLEWDMICDQKDSFFHRLLSRFKPHEFFRNEFWPLRNKDEWASINGNTLYRGNA